MEKSESVSRILKAFEQGSETWPMTDMLPFSGLGFDLCMVPAGRIRLATPGNEGAHVTAPSLFDTVFLSGRWLQLRLGREIRGR
jgi:hypothetical protein